MIKKILIWSISTIFVLNCGISRAWYFRDALFLIACVLMNAKALIEIPDLTGNSEEKENKAKEDIFISVLSDIALATSKSCQNVEDNLKSNAKNTNVKLDKKI